MQEIATLDLHYSDNAIDTFGDAYEYLMRMYADKAGKSGGEFFTPQEVSYLLARLVSYGKQSVNKVYDPACGSGSLLLQFAAGKSGGEFFTPQEVSYLLARLVSYGKQSVNKVYDPACGSGSLLLQFAKVLGIDNIKQGFFGQEINPTSYNLCRINMLLHDIGFENFDIALGDTLLEPKRADDEPFDAIVSNPPYSTKWIGDDDPKLINGFENFDIALGDTLLEPKRADDEPFDAIVSNPPYSTKWIGDDDPKLINDPRFAPAGVLAPKGYADLAFTMHMLSWLSPSGTCAIVEFPGVLYRDKKEKQIRKYLIDQNFIDTIIQLPENLFFGTNIATSIIVLKKNKQSVATLFIDASEQFTKITKKNILESTHINLFFGTNIATSIIVLKKNKQSVATLFIDASEQFTKITKKNILESTHINTIVEAYAKTSIIVLKKNKQSVATLFIDASEQFTKITKKNILESTHINTIVEAYAKREDIEHFSRLVSLEEIRANDYNLSTSTYITPKDTREHIDIVVLNATIKDIVTRQTHLRQKLDSIITSLGE